MANTVNRAINNLTAEVNRPQIDKEATEDRPAVAAAMRGVLGKLPAEAPPEYGSMNTAEFEAEKEKAMKQAGHSNGQRQNVESSAPRSHVRFRV